MAEAFVLIPVGAADRGIGDFARDAAVLGFDRVTGPYAGVVHVRASADAIISLATKAGAEASTICWVRHLIQEESEGAT